MIQHRTKQESFIRFVQILRDNPELYRLFQTLQNQNELKRNLELTQMLTQMQQDQAPEELQYCITMLRKKEVFTQIQEILAGEHSSSED